jgi:hypothetical protein
MRTGEPAYSAVMSQSDPTAVLAGMKRTEALLRDARSVLRRVDALAAKASTSDDPSRALIAEVGTAAEHLVSLRASQRPEPALTAYPPDLQSACDGQSGADRPSK